MEVTNIKKGDLKLITCQVIFDVRRSPLKNSGYANGQSLYPVFWNSLMFLGINTYLQWVHWYRLS